MTDTAKAQVKAEVLEIIEQLGLDDLRVFRFQGRRMLRIGYPKYGELVLGTDGRTWNREIAEESADRMFYESCREISREDARQDRINRFKHADSIPHDIRDCIAPPSDFLDTVSLACLHTYVDGVCAGCGGGLP